MTIKTFPDFGGGDSSGGGGGGQVTFPLVGPPGQAGQETFAFTSGGGLHGTPAGDVVLSAGQAGDALRVTAQGDIDLVHQLNVSGLSALLGGISTTNISADSITTTGNIGIGGSLGVQGSAQLTGDLSARKISASSDLSAGSLSTSGAIAGASINITGAATIGSLNVSGTFRASQIESEGALLFPVSDSSMPGIGLGEQPSTGIFGISGTLGFAVAGSRVLSLAENLTASFAGDLSAQGITADSLTAQGPISGQLISVAALQATGNATVQGDAHVGGDFHVDGISRLANLRIDALSTDADLEVGQDAVIDGKLTVKGVSTLQGLTATSLSAGDTSLARLLIQKAGMLAGPAGYVPVRQEPIPGQPGTIDYVVTLDPGGNLSMSGDLFVGRGMGSAGNIQTGGDLNAVGGYFSGALTGGAAATFTGDLTAASVTYGGARLRAGAGAPTGSVVGSVGDQYVDRTSGSFYLKLSGQNTDQGWVSVSTAASSLSFPLQAPDTQPSAGPSYAFASSSGDGLGSAGVGSLYLAVANSAVIQIETDGTVSINNAVNAQALNCTGLNSQSFANAGDATVGGKVSAARLQIANEVVAASAQLSGKIAAQTTDFGGIQCSGDAHIGGALSVDGTITSASTIAATAAILGGAAVRSGMGSPTGSVSGAPGDAYLDRTAGDLWLKTSGQQTSSGWTKVSTAAAGTTFPLAAPNGSAASPSYGFTQGGLGITATGSQLLAGVSGGAVGWTLGPDLAFAAKGALSVAGAATLAALSATQGTFSGTVSASGLTGGSLTVSGASSLAGLTAGSTSVSSLTSQAGLTAGTTVTIAGSTISSASGQPSSGSGQQGDLALTTGGSVPLYVRGSSAWRAVALVGDPTPTAFPLRAPADSVSAPSFAWAASTTTGLFSPGANQLGFVTNGVQAGSVSASQNWTLAGSLTAGAATFPSATINGALSASGNATIGGTLGVTGAVTLASSLSSGDIVSSGQVTSQTATVNGLLSAQTATTSGDVTIGGSLTVNGTTTYAGVQRTGYIQTGDGSVTSPAVAFTAETGLGSWRSAAGTYAIAAGGANVLTVTSSLLTVAGAVRIGGTNAGLMAPGANSLALQTAGTAALTFSGTQAAAFASTVTAPVASATSVAYGLGSSGSGLYGFSGSGKINPAISQGGNTVAAFTRGAAANNYPFWSITLGDATDSISNTVASQGFIYGSSTPPSGQVTGTAGSIYCHWATGATTPAIYINESPAGTPSATAWQRVLTTSTTLTPTFPLVGPAGTSTAPTFAVGSSNTGIYSGSDTYSTPFIGITQGAKPVAFLQSFTSNSATVLAINLGDPSGTANIGGLKASTIAPAGNIGGAPGQIYQYLGGGTDNSIFVYEGTSPGTGGWAKVLTSSSPVSVTFPIKAPISSATAPSYGFGGTSGYASTGMFAAQETSSSSPVVAFASNGSAVGFFQAQTVNSQPLNNLFFGAASAPSGGIRVSPQSPVNTIGGLQGQLYLNTAGGVGTSLWIKESFNSGNGTLGWSSVLTSGLTQIATQQGSVAAPFYSFNGATNTGLAFVNDQGFGTGSSTGLVTQGRVVAYVSAGSANSVAINTLVLGDPSTVSSPYPAAIRGSAQAASGNIVGAIGQVAINTAGGAGTVLAVKESSPGSTSGWSLVLTEGSAPRYFSITTGSQVSNVSGRVLIWADTSNQLRAGSFVNSTSTPIIKQEISSTQYGATQTLSAVNNGTNIWVNAAQNLTLPAGSSTVDLWYRFQTEANVTLTIIANSGQTIAFGNTQSASGGNISTTKLGSYVELFLRAGGTIWVARGPSGAWTVT